MRRAAWNGLMPRPKTSASRRFVQIYRFSRSARWNSDRASHYAVERQHAGELDMTEELSLITIGIVFAFLCAIVIGLL
jgi:hypothetical protein